MKVEMAMILGKKIGMTQVYDEAGNRLPVTVIQAGPCTVTQLKTKETDGYAALQLGFDDVKTSRQRKSQIGHAAKADSTPKRFVREWRIDDGEEYEAGQSVTVSAFSDDKWVTITGTSKGKGFAGAMKRHGFGGFPQSHGTKRAHRRPGSVAAFASDAGHGGDLKKGKPMPGQMGNKTITSRNHSLVSVDEENNLLVVKGSVPGAAGSYLIIKSSQKKK